MNYIPLAQAFFCVTCEAVVDSNVRCPGCGGHICLLNLAMIMNRKKVA